MVQGIADLNKKVAAIPARVETRARAAMEKGADELVAMMKRLVPVDDGDLRDSIGWTWGDAPAGSMVLGTVRQSGRGAGNMTVTVFAGDDKAYYSRWVEFGTRKMAAQPFFFPAYRAVRKRVRARTARAIKNAAKKAAAAGGVSVT